MRPRSLTWQQSSRRFIPSRKPDVGLLHHQRSHKSDRLLSGVTPIFLAHVAHCTAVLLRRARSVSLSLPLCLCRSLRSPVPLARPAMRAFARCSFDKFVTHTPSIQYSAFPTCLTLARIAYIVRISHMGVTRSMISRTVSVYNNDFRENSRIVRSTHF